MGIGDRLLYLGEEQGGVFAYNLDNADAERARVPLSGEENPVGAKYPKGLFLAQDGFNKDASGGSPAEFQAG